MMSVAPMITPQIISMNKKPRLNVVISLDDCHVSDLRASKLLHKHGFKGIFYMPSSQVRNTILLSLKEVKEGIISLGHELGGHTVSHPMDLKLVTDDAKLKFEIENNQMLCEMLMKSPVKKFCYPRGRHDERVRKAVKDAGFLEARTTQVLKIRNDSGDPFQTPTTVHMFQREEYDGIHWFEIAKTYFDEALEASKNEDGIFFSLWGHSNELDRQNDWEKFEELLLYIKSKWN